MILHETKRNITYKDEDNFDFLKIIRGNQTGVINKTSLKPNQTNKTLIKYVNTPNLNTV